jgi:hypothetical protein
VTEADFPPLFISDVTLVACFDGSWMTIHLSPPWVVLIRHQIKVKTVHLLDNRCVGLVLSFMMKYFNCILLLKVACQWEKKALRLGLETCG